ncbi:carboxyl-terminal processing protease [Lachnospiraceae bacterium PM6-15]|uniref:S41 family peptidase n=1 Tax=Ohessyouella blattaphilus TaxID=2949333 RepID=A0ABT1EJ36_9FIRM|nr:S41 family peptidase [Ohessyouella blattaphilus]MCP1110711.1 S41 family peptidase [Ohessyouella blattaphilus]MCR8564105.1 S41 family peptidase [Ohessyouella blattaphilus]
MYKRLRKGALLSALCILLITVLAGCSILQKKDVLKEAQTEEALADVDTKLNLLEEYIEQVYLHDVDADKLKEGIYKGFIAGLDDPYSAYYTVEETKLMNESNSGQYSGIGALLNQNRETGAISVVRVYADSPAEEAGLRAGDIFLKVGDRELTSEDDLSEVVTHIKGEEGTEVTLTMYRTSEEKEFEVTATRRKLEVETVTAEMKADNIGYLVLSEFDQVSYDQFKQGVEDLESQGMTSLIVDLRGNPGGSLQIVADILDRMLPEGLTVYMEDRDGKKTEFTSDKETEFTKPLVVLVDGNSASASEIFAGAIQDYGQGTIMGTKTYGKGVVQEIFPLKDGSSLKLTIAEYFTPKGRSVEKEGITPDVEVKYEYNEANPDQDNQLDEAIAFLQNEQNK